MSEQNANIVRNAISRSCSQNETVHCAVSESSEEIHILIDASQLAEWDYSSENRDEDGNEVLDVYSLEHEADQWRIKITFEK